MAPSSPRITIARVDEKGNVTAQGDGEATITAKVGGAGDGWSWWRARSETMPTPSFRNHVMPMLTRPAATPAPATGRWPARAG